MGCCVLVVPAVIFPHHREATSNAANGHTQYSKHTRTINMGLCFENSCCNGPVLAGLEMQPAQELLPRTLIAPDPLGVLGGIKHIVAVDDEGNTRLLHFLLLLFGRAINCLISTN